MARAVCVVCTACMRMRAWFEIEMRWCVGGFAYKYSIAVSPVKHPSGSTAILLLCRSLTNIATHGPTNAPRVRRRTIRRKAAATEKEQRCILILGVFNIIAFPPSQPKPCVLSLLAPTQPYFERTTFFFAFPRTGPNKRQKTSPTSGHPLHFLTTLEDAAACSPTTATNSPLRCSPTLINPFNMPRA